MESHCSFFTHGQHGKQVGLICFISLLYEGTAGNGIWKRTLKFVVLLSLVFSRELLVCQIKIVKRPFTVTVLTVIPLVKFAVVIITFYIHSGLLNESLFYHF